MADAAALPPEINSGLVHGGAGPIPLETAAAAYSAAAAQDLASAQAIQQIMTSARSSWQGSAAEGSTASLMPLITWFQTNSANASATAAGLSAAAGAVASAIVTTPHPGEVTTNRTNHHTAVATNFFGIRTPEIIATNAEYLVMWLRGATGRLGSDTVVSATAGGLPAWTPPPMPVNPAAMGAAMAHATSVSVKGASGVLDAAVLRGVQGEAAADLARAAAGDMASPLMVQPGTAPFVEAAGQAPQQANKADQFGNNPMERAGEQLTSGGDMMGSMVGQLGSVVSSVGQIPAQLGSQVTQPFQQVASAPMQFSSMLQPLMSGMGGANKLTSGQSDMLASSAGDEIARGTGELSGALTRPAGGIGDIGAVPAAGLRLPDSSMMAASSLASAAGSAAVARGPAPAVGGYGGTPGMFAPMHGMHQRSGADGPSANKYADAVQIGPQAS